MAQFGTNNWRYAPSTYEILFDGDTIQAVCGGPIPWGQGSDNWRADGIDPTLFPPGFVPMKPASVTPNGDRNHAVAAKYYCLAHRQGNAIGIPR